MSYEKTLWNNGDVITAEKLNNIENGIADAGGEVIPLTLLYDSNNDEYSITEEEYQKLYNKVANKINYPVVITIRENGSDDYVEQGLFYIENMVNENGASGYFVCQRSYTVLLHLDPIAFQLGLTGFNISYSGGMELRVTPMSCYTHQECYLD